MILLLWVLFQILCSYMLLAKATTNNADNRLILEIQASHLRNTSTPITNEIYISNVHAKEAYTFMYCSRPEIDQNSAFYDVLRLLVYKVSILNQHYSQVHRDVIVLVCSYISDARIESLKTLVPSAIVIMVDPIIPAGPLSGNMYYIDQFTKLHL